MKIQLPDKVNRIIHTLEDAGFEAYAVGGCVRDSVLGREPADWDITTSAKPLQVKELFEKTVDTGLAHGTVTVLLGREGFEVTTYRIDGTYEDCRHPSEVSFTADLREDLRRRDFTMNAMAYNDRDGLVDIFGGEEDMKSGIIRCVGNAEERFSEDALRILRAVRFAAQLGYGIEEETAAAASLLAGNLANISAERICTELVKMLTSPHPELLRTAYELGLTKVFLPEFDAAMETEQNNPHHMYSVGEHTLKAMTFVEDKKHLRLAMLFHDLGKTRTKTTDEDGVDHFHGHAQAGAEMAVSIMHRLKMDNDTIDRVKRLVYYHDVRPGADPVSVRRLMNRVGKDNFEDLMQVSGADVLAQSSYHKMEKLMAVETVADIYAASVVKGECTTLKELAVTGKDLIAAGMKPGKEIGEVLQRLLEDVLEEPEHNRKEYLLARAFEN